MICPIDATGYCTRHGRIHIGHAADIAIDPSEKGESHRRLWDRFVGKSAPYSSSKPLLRSLLLAKQCQHLGAQLTPEEGKQHYEELLRLGVKCNSCGGKRYEYHCSEKKFTNLAKCGTCTLWKPSSLRSEQAVSSEQPTLTVDNTTRNLIYHIYPVAGNSRWQWNVEQLCGRLKCFNGKIIVAIVTDPPEGRLPDPDGPLAPDRGRIIRGCDSAAEVKAEFARRWSGKPIEFMEMENDPKLREVKPLIPMLEEVLTDDPYSITLYAQAKGVTRAPGHIAHRWTEALYEIMLDYFPLAIEQMNTHPVTGCFKKLGPGWSPQQSKSDWHYSGSWFWFRTASLAAKAYWNVDQFWSGIEPYPSQQWLAAEAGCMFHTEQVPAMNLYNGRYWGRTVNPAFNQWRAEHEQYRTTMWPK